MRRVGSLASKNVRGPNSERLVNPGPAPSRARRPLTVALAAVAFGAILAATGTPTAAAGTIQGQLQVAVDAGAMTARERTETLASYRALGRMAGNDWKVMRSTVRRLASEDRLADLALAVHASLTVAARRGNAPAGSRDRTRGSAIVVQRMAGSGWWFHPLASSGQLNALAQDRRTSVKTLTAAADGLLRLGRKSSRGLRFEYLFAWYGAGPGWISAMPQATMASALARVSEKSGNRAYVEQGLAAGEPLHWRPPAGTSVPGPGGVDPLLYPSRTRYLVANAEIWALIGMDQLAKVSGDGRTAALSDRIASRLLRIMPGWADPDRPGWTLYAQGSQARGEGAASTSYHELTVQGLRRLCRSRRGSWCTWAERFGKDVPASISSLPGREPVLGGAQ